MFIPNVAIESAENTNKTVVSRIISNLINVPDYGEKEDLKVVVLHGICGIRVFVAIGVVQAESHVVRKALFFNGNLGTIVV